MVLGLILLAGVVCSVIGHIKRTQHGLNDLAFALYAIALIFFVITMFTSYLYVTTESQPVHSVQIIDDKVYYIQSDGTRRYVKLNSVSFTFNTLSLNEATLIKTCTANPTWLSIPLTNCRWRVYASYVNIGPQP